MRRWTCAVMMVALIATVPFALAEEGEENVKVDDKRAAIKDRDWQREKARSLKIR